MQDKAPKQLYSPRFLGNYIIRGKIECLTGLHIGGSSDKLEIGGVDSPVVRNPKNKEPYIPGSSLKGKMRHLLEYALGVVNIDPDEYGNVSDCPKITRIFGIGADDNNGNTKRIPTGPTRLIVRDCFPDKKTVGIWQKLDSELLFTEYKAENTINRITSAANPRFIERVVEGSMFNFEMVYNILDMGTEGDKAKIQEDLNHIWEGLRLLEHDFIGKSGSRGYGRIQFHLAPVIKVTTENYINGTENYVKSMKDISEYELAPLHKISTPIYNS